MAAKLLYSLTDGNPELQKQMGCMTGIFQIFDRQHIVSGRRIDEGHSHKKPPLGSSHCNNGSSKTGSDNPYRGRPSLETNPNKNVYEKQRFSAESSRVSFSASSCSSSTSSQDCYRIQPESSPFNQTNFPDTSSRDSFISQTNYGSPTSEKKSLDIPDLIKDTCKKDLPRSLQLSKSVNGSYGFAENSDFSSPFYEFHDGFIHMVSKDNSRFSYDGKEMNRRSFESRETIRSSQNPRLSLDSRESSMRHFSNDKIPISLQETIGNTPKRPPSVVAKLMGLDALPDSPPASDNRTSVIETRPLEDFETLISTKTMNSLGPIRISDTPINSWKGPTSPRRKNHDLAMRPVLNSRLPIESAPWKHQDPTRVSPKTNSRNFKSPVRESNKVPSVYSEIEKRLKDLEFKQSGKDLRALKQILEAMQTKEPFETQNEEPTSNFATRKDFERKLVNSRDHVGSSSKRFESPIVIMKPAKLGKKMDHESSKHMQRDHNVGSTCKSPNGKNVGPAQSSTRAQHLPKENTTSPRLVQKKIHVENRSRPPTPPDTSKSRKQEIESKSPGGKRRPKIEQNDDKMSDISNESQNSDKNHNDSRSLSKKKIAPRLHKRDSLAEHVTVPIEHTSPVSVLDTSGHRDDSLSPVNKIESFNKGDESGSSLPTCTDEKFNAIDNNNVGPICTSVINRTKLQNIENLVQKLKRLNSTHDEARTDYIASLCDDTSTDHRYISEILLASGLLLRDLGSSLTTLQLHPSGQPINPELFFVLEQTKTKKLEHDNNGDKIHRKFIFDAVNEILVIKLALLNTAPGLTPSQITKKSMNTRQLLKELCFDVDQLQTTKLKSGFDEEEDGLKRVLSEDVIYRSENWMDLNGEISGLVLDVERSVFKELVNEVVIGEMADLRTVKPGKRYKKLFY